MIVQVYVIGTFTIFCVGKKLKKTPENGVPAMHFCAAVKATLKGPLHRDT